MKLKRLAGAATLALAIGAGWAHAETLFSFTGPTGQIGSPGSRSFDLTAGAGGGAISFRLDGFFSLDGDGLSCCTDIFTLSLNGADVFSGSWDMGGGGNNVVFFGPMGATASTTRDPRFGHGGFTDIFVPLTLALGTNMLGFRYSGRDEGFSNEGWGLENVVVTGSSAGGVTESASWAMMLLGFAGVGSLIRDRRGSALA